MLEKNVDIRVVRAIYQFLDASEFPTTAESFKTECENQNFEVIQTVRQPRPPAVTNDLKKRLLQALNRNDKSRFFKIFSEAFPPSEATSNLEFRAQIFFATAPLRKNPPNKSEFRNQLDDLKIYLEDGAGAAMASDTELLPYFALPYVNDPVKHPVFRKLLSKNYFLQLQTQISRLIHSGGTRNLSPDSDSGDDECKIISWKQAYDEFRQNPQSGGKILYKDYQELQDDYYKIVDIASELIDCLEQSVQGKTIPPELFAELASRLADSSSEAERRMQRSAMAVSRAYPTTLPSTRSPQAVQRRNRSLNHRTTVNDPKFLRRRAEPIKKAESTGSLIPADPKARPSPPNDATYTLPSKAKANKVITVDENKLFVMQLNFPKISNQLIKNPGTRSSALLLQALRLQLTKQGKVVDALPVLWMYIEKDVLMLKNRKCSVVASIVALGEPSLDTKEQLARLLNAIASFKAGRDYLLGLSQGREMLYQIALALRTKKLINCAADHTLAALEKLSVRSSVQKELILSGMIEWLLSYLEPSSCSFSLEYGTALLTNLSINSVAQSSIFRYRERLLNLMVRFVEHANVQLVSLALNVLYVFFTFAKMRSAAKEVNMETTLSDRLARTDSPDIESQLAVVIRAFHGEIDPTHRQTTNDEAASPEGEDYLEAEIDSTDTLIPAMTELFGETLIGKRYNMTPQVVSTAVEEVVAPPGTVPRRHMPPVALPRGKTSLIGRRYIGKRNVSVGGSGVPPVPAPPRPDSPTSATDARLSSVASFATFIADNDRRKPLISLTGLKAAAHAYRVAKTANADSQTARKAPKQSLPVTEAVIEESGKHQRLRRRSESFEDGHPTAVTVNLPILTKSTSTSVIPDLTAPVARQLGAKIPDDANPNEYIAAFGSRPKITRTPDHKQKSDVFIF